MTKRAPGTGTVQFHNGRFRLKLPRSLDPTRSWLSETFRADQEAEAHAVMDECVREQRARLDARDRDEGVTFASLWPRHVALVVRTAERRHERSGRKARARLAGMGDNWLSRAPFWQKSLDTIGGAEIKAWLRDVQLAGRNAKGAPISDSWVAQCSAAVRGVFELAELPCPAFDIELEYSKVKNALNLAQQERFLQEVVRDPLDQIMCGCQLGAGLRVGELLSLELEHVHVGHDPHLQILYGGPNHAPTKSGKPRRVELVEPGLGFFRLAVEHHYRPNDRGLLFAGPQGGYRSDWPDRFVEWSKRFGSRQTTHSLRHSWAFSMLSGLWGYPPVDITFVSMQFGHQDIRTTQKAYGHWDPGAGLVTARMLRRETERTSEPVTAECLLGRGPRGPLRSPLSSRNPLQKGVGVSDGSGPEPRFFPMVLPDVARDVAHESARALLEQVAAGRDPGALTSIFLLSLGEHPGALMARSLLAQGSPLALVRAVELAEQVYLHPPPTVKGNTA